MYLIIKLGDNKHNIMKNYAFVFDESHKLFDEKE